MNPWLKPCCKLASFPESRPSQYPALKKGTSKKCYVTDLDSNKITAQLDCMTTSHDENNFKTPCTACTMAGGKGR